MPKPRRPHAQDRIGWATVNAGSQEAPDFRPVVGLRNRAWERIAYFLESPYRLMAEDMAANLTDRTRRDRRGRWWFK